MLNWPQRVKLLKICGTLFLIAFFMPFFAHGQTVDLPATYTNQNFVAARHDTPVAFSLVSGGGFIGTTQTGKVFRQFPIFNTSNIRLQRFEIDTAFFYISDRGIIIADSDLVALSIYATLG